MEYFPYTLESKIKIHIDKGKGIPFINSDIQLVATHIMKVRNNYNWNFLMKFLGVTLFTFNGTPDFTQGFKNLKLFNFSRKFWSPSCKNWTGGDLWFAKKNGNFGYWWKNFFKDFGVSKILHESTIGKTLVGTPGFIAPEVLKQNFSVGYSQKADSKKLFFFFFFYHSNFCSVWSYAILLCEVMTFSKPKSSGVPPPLPILKESTKKLQPILNIIQECLQVNPSLRPESAKILFQLS